VDLHFVGEAKRKLRGGNCALRETQHERAKKDVGHAWKDGSIISTGESLTETSYFILRVTSRSCKKGLGRLALPVGHIHRTVYLKNRAYTGGIGR